MIALLQRVRWARVDVGATSHARIGPGLLVLLGVARGDDEAAAVSLARRVSALRIFEDDRGRMNLSLEETGGEALVVPQFTLLADCTQGHRPGFSDAAPPSQAEPLYVRFAEALGACGIPVSRGVFGAHMAVSLENDGPVTFMVESRRGIGHGRGSARGG